MPRRNRIRFVRGTEAQILADPPMHGEPVVATDTDNVYIGTAAGRVLLVRGSDLAHHSSATTGLHGVGPSHVESMAGAQARVDAHGGAHNPHPQYATVADFNALLRVLVNVLSRPLWVDPTTSRVKTDTIVTGGSLTSAGTVTAVGSVAALGTGNVTGAHIDLLTWANVVRSRIT